MTNVMLLFLLVPVLNIASTACMNLEFLTSIDFPSTEELHQNPLAAILRTIVGNIYQSLRQGEDEKSDLISNMFNNLDTVLHNIDEEDLKFAAKVVGKEMDVHIIDHSGEKHGNDLFKKYVKGKIKETTQNGALQLKTDLIAKSNSSITNQEFISLLRDLFSTDDLAHFNIFLKTFHDHSQNNNREMQEKTIQEALHYYFVEAHGKMHEQSKDKLDEALVNAFGGSEKAKPPELEQPIEAENGPKEIF